MTITHKVGNAVYEFVLCATAVGALGYVGFRALDWYITWQFP